MKKKKPTFVRQESVRYLRLGKKKKSLRKWRRPRGKSSKIRLKRFSYSPMPSVGYKTPKKESGRIHGLIPKLVHNQKELESLTKDNIAILARVGAKKKLELIKKADELKIKVLNLNSRGRK
ncbi:MAG: 50S ribosomal protein L32e [Candidatus Pacearchaeota archaeon]|nr:50S ribosomal protein L32e [Candidatus Pacearchaeota archaeon]